MNDNIDDTHYRAIGLRSRVFANGPEDRGSIPGRVIPKTQKMVLDASLINTQHYKVRIKGKVEQSKEWRSALPYSSVLYLLKKGSFGSPLTKVANLYIYTSYIYVLAIEKGALTKIAYFTLTFHSYGERTLWLGFAVLDKSHIPDYIR